jgi:hypothetical protein
MEHHMNAADKIANFATLIIALQEVGLMINPTSGHNLAHGSW